MYAGEGRGADELIAPLFYRVTAWDISPTEKGAGNPARYA